MEYIKNEGSVADKKEIERLTAENEKLQARLAYVAMMTDVDLPEDEEDISDAQ